MSQTAFSLLGYLNFGSIITLSSLGHVHMYRLYGISFIYLLIYSIRFNFE